MNSNIDPLERRVRKVFAEASDRFDACLMREWAMQAEHDIPPWDHLADHHPDELAYQGLHGEDRPGYSWP